MSTDNNKRRAKRKLLDGVDHDELRHWFEKVELPSQALKAALDALGEQTQKVEQHRKPKPAKRKPPSARTKRRASDAA